MLHSVHSLTVGGGLLRPDEEKLLLNTVLLVVTMTMTLLFISPASQARVRTMQKTKSHYPLSLLGTECGYGVKHPVRLRRNKRPLLTHYGCGRNMQI